MIHWLAQIITHPTVAGHVGATLDRYYADPGELLCHTTADGRTFGWRDGDIGVVTWEAWRDLYDWLDYMPWELVVLATGIRETGMVYYVTRGTK